jgi:Protein phosphatase 2A regulatory B subunit (B56 family)
MHHAPCRFLSPSAWESGHVKCYDAVAGRLTLGCFASFLQDIIFMLSANLFRALPPSRGADQENYDPDEEEPTLEPTWPHLQVHSSSETTVGVCRSA